MSHQLDPQIAYGSTEISDENHGKTWCETENKQYLLILYSLSFYRSQVNMELADGIARKLFIPFGKAGYDDLAARNIQRGRDHGIHVYGVWRKLCKQPAVNTFEDLNNYMEKGAAELFKKLYSHPNDIDLFAAGLAERHLPGLMVGPTFSCIFRHQFTGLREGDRFFYRANGVFTPNQVREIQKMSMAKMLCNNLKKSVSIQRNVFKAFDKTNDRRVSCDSISGIDLQAWKEKEPVKEPATCNIGKSLNSLNRFYFLFHVLQKNSISYSMCIQN